jgi:hypothetical protein
MQTIWEPRARQELLGRLGSLKPESHPQWGRMNCKQMLAHLCDAMRMPLGEITIAAKASPLRLKPVRHAVIYWFPFPKGAPTAPELIERQAEDWQAEADDLKHLLGRLAERHEQTSWPEHPIFGQMSQKDWGALAYKHIDHHFRQFGV